MMRNLPLRLSPVGALLALVTLQNLHAQEPADPVQAMDYGPFLSATFGAPFPHGNVTHKGVAIALRDGGVIFDTELLRVSAAWHGRWLNLRGTAYDGAHGPYSSPAGELIHGTEAKPGWAAEKGFVDPRATPHGPMPREHGRWRGLYVHGDRVTLSYDVHGIPVLEAFSHAEAAGRPMIVRTLELPERTQMLTLLVGQRPRAEAELRNDRVVWSWEPPAPARVTRARTTGAWTDLPHGAPSASDLLDAHNGGQITWVEGFGGPHARAGAADDRALPRLNDGAAAGNDDDTSRVTWFDSKQARLIATLPRVADVRRIDTYSWHRGNRAAQRFKVFGTAAEAPADAVDPAAAGWTPIASVETRQLGNGGKHAVAIAEPDGGSLGEFRRLLFVLEQPDEAGQFLTEIDLFAAGMDGAAPPKPPVPESALIAVRGNAQLAIHGDDVVAIVPPGGPTRIALVSARMPRAQLAAVEAAATALDPAPLEPHTKPGPARYPQVLETRGTLGPDDGAFAVDTITVPETNPWHSRLRFGAFDFFSDGRAALCTWNGDVWVVSGIDAGLEKLRWRRFATGLFDPLGLRIVGDVVHTLGRDQITRLHDRDADGEADWYECFNNDVLVTDGFHEFAFDLQTDAEGNFYFSKGGPVNPGGRGFQKLVPHHGTILKVDREGQGISVFATGLRAPNGIGVGPNGEVTSGDNQGTWMPACRLNWIRPGSFQGCVDTAHREPAPATYDPPICFLPMHVDNSGGGQVWVPPGTWGPLAGNLLHLSYGQCVLYNVLKEEIDGVVQGGVVAFPLSFASSLMRGRFGADGHLYLVGFRGWQTRAARETAFHRVRATGKPLRMPNGIHVNQRGIRLDFTDPLDPATAEDPQSYAVEMWNYSWSEAYGSPEISVRNPPPPEELAKLPTSHVTHDPVGVRSAKLSADKRSVFLELEEVRQVMQMKISIDVDAADGAPVRHDVYLSIHKIPDA